MTIAKARGRRVRTLNGQIDLDLAESKAAISETRQVLYNVLAERDPVEYHRAMMKALTHLNLLGRLLESAHVHCYEIEQICAVDAKRGEYGK